MPAEISSSLKSSSELLVNPVRRSAPTIGIIGAGQLARMTALAAFKSGCNVNIFGHEHDSPALHTSTHFFPGHSSNLEDLRSFAKLCDVISIENEFIDWHLLHSLELDGCKVLPSSETVRLVQDKLLQKQSLAAAGLPLPRFRPVRNVADILISASEFGWPVLLKGRRDGYDGKGNFTLRSASDLKDALKALNREPQQLYVEEFCPFTAELAIIVTRSTTRELAVYPLVESVQKDHICREIIVPARVSDATAQRALHVATAALEAVGAIGTFGVEMFLTAGGDVLINELAPRVHNSGHYTIEACICSQFENHVRALLGWPLGSTSMLAPSAAMVNLLGKTSASGVPSGLDKALAVPGSHVHIYGKSRCEPGRKMGHVTALGATPEQALTAARRAAGEITFQN